MGYDFDEEDRDLPQEGDLADDEMGGDVVPCPSCGREVYEDAERCPHCGDWITPRAGGPLPWVWVVAALLALAGMVVITIF